MMKLKSVRNIVKAFQIGLHLERATKNVIATQEQEKRDDADWHQMQTLTFTNSDIQASSFVRCNSTEDLVHILKYVLKSLY